MIFKWCANYLLALLCVYFYVHWKKILTARKACSLTVAVTTWEEAKLKGKEPVDSQGAVESTAARAVRATARSGRWHRLGLAPAAPA